MRTTTRSVLSTAVALTLVVLTTGTPARAADDALHRRVLAELSGFTNWLAANHVKGAIGETGWPDNTRGDSPQWNDLGNAWFTAADAAYLPVSYWASGTLWPADYKLTLYRSSQGYGHALDTAGPQAQVVEAHKTSGEALRGTQDAGGAFCWPGTEKTSKFSNRSQPAFGDFCYHYDDQASLGFVASRGAKLVRLDFRWEVLQRKPGTDLSTADVQHLVDWAKRAETAGLVPIVDMHNFGQYYLAHGKRGVRTALGSKRLPITTFAGFWGALSRAFAGDHSVIFGLMNEPVLLPTKSGAPQRVWEQASQAAVDAIRAAGADNTIYVAGYNYSAVESWTQNHPGAWITDPANNFRYEGHHYFDPDGSGGYAVTYDQAVADAQQRGF